MLPAFLSTKYANISTLTQHTQIVVTNRLPNVLEPTFHVWARKPGGEQCQKYS
jgi:hypothetical protein